MDYTHIIIKILYLFMTVYKIISTQKVKGYYRLLFVEDCV